MQPTRANNVLDLLLTDLPSEDQNTLAVPGISDHSAVLCELNLHHVKVVNSGARRIYSYKKANTAMITEALDRYYNVLETLSDTSHTEDIWVRFKSKLFELGERHGPSWLMPARRSKNRPWFMGDVQRLVRKRQNAYSKFKEGGAKEILQLH